MSDHPFERAKDLALSRLKEQTRISTLTFAGTQVDVHPATGAKIIKVGGYDAGDPARRLHTVVVESITPKYRYPYYGVIDSGGSASGGSTER